MGFFREWFLYTSYVCTTQFYRSTPLWRDFFFNLEYSTRYIFLQKQLHHHQQTFMKLLLCLSTVTRILLVTTVKQHEFETNLTNNSSVNLVLNQQDIYLDDPKNHFKALILLNLAKIEIFLRINHLCAHAIFKVQIKPDYTLSLKQKWEIQSVFWSCPKKRLDLYLGKGSTPNQQILEFPWSNTVCKVSAISSLFNLNWNKIHITRNVIHKDSNCCISSSSVEITMNRTTAFLLKKRKTHR